MIRQQIIVRGMVQGVGFRYRAKHAADSLRLTGWVHNEFDGSVHMEVQGDISDINKMLGMIQAGIYVMITDMERKELPIDEEERSFHIR